MFGFLKFKPLALRARLPPDIDFVRLLSTLAFDFTGALKA
jgi:hypothetical protein